jgi:3-hydroxyisobutyrate dehydrogenase-like beta-hydroxyacid dehydrogenase
VGRIGVPLIEMLLADGYSVVCCERGRSSDAVELGATVAGDGTPRAVADAAAIVCTCLPDKALDDVVAGPDGVLAAGGPTPTIIDLSTAEVDRKERLREMLVAAGGEMLDCPISGTPEMVKSGRGVVYASGTPEAHARVEPVLHVLSPNGSYVGDFGAGTTMKFVANYLAFLHLTVTAEAMAFARGAGLDLQQVADIVSQSPGATSGQFGIRAPRIAAGDFEPRQGTVDMLCEIADQIADVAERGGVSTPLFSTMRSLFRDIADRGEGASDPCRLTLELSGAGAPTV